MLCEAPHHGARLPGTYGGDVFVKAIKQVDVHLAKSVRAAKLWCEACHASGESRYPWLRASHIAAYLVNFVVHFVENLVTTSHAMQLTR